LKDGFGHAAGDEALVRVGSILQAGVREGTSSRASEGPSLLSFSAVRPSGADREAPRRADRQQHARGRPPAGQDRLGRGRCDRRGDLDELVEAADRAMYLQKQQMPKRTSA
jgi:GGDEF domain-containing protein